MFLWFCTSGDYTYPDLLGDESNEMGDYLDTVPLGDDFTPIKLTSGQYFNCALSFEKAIKCWGELSALSD